MFHLKTSLCNEGGDDAGAGGATPQDPATDWRSSLPEGVREWQEAQTSKSPDDFYKQMDHYRSSYGRSIRVPGEDAGPEDRAKFLDRLRKDAPELIPAPNPEDADAMQSLYQSLGVPGEASGYKAPDIVSERADYIDQSEMENFRSLAKQLNLTQAQFNGVVDGYLRGQFDAYDQQQATNEKDHVDLRTEMGLTYEPKMNAAKEVMRQHGFPDQIIDMFAEAKMGKHSTKAFISLAEAVGGEGVNLAGEKSPSQPSMTPDEARAQAAEIRNNRKGPYWNQADPGHMAARRKVRELMIMAQGGKNREIDLQPATIGRGGGIQYGDG